MSQQKARGAWLAALAAVAAACTPMGMPGEPEPRERPRDERPEPSREAPLTLGLLLPQSGSQYLQQYGALILEGVQLAVDAHTAQGGRPVEIRIEDTGGSAAGAERAVRRLEEAGAIGAVGPLLPEEVSGALAGRSDARFPIISPSSPDAPSGENAYSLNAGDTRGAEMLAQWAVRNAAGPIGILHPIGGDGDRQARAFADAVQRAGGTVALRMSYGETTTTFQQQMERLSAAGIRTLFIPATEREIPQLAPQLAYYGLGDVQVLGGEAWTSETLLKTLPTRVTEGVIAATPLIRTDPAVAWEDLVASYEARYRRSLNHPFPGLGYDAALLVLAAVEQGADNAREVAGEIADLEGVRGATGIISVRGGAVERAPFLVRIEGGRLVKLEGPTR